MSKTYKPVCCLAGFGFGTTSTASTGGGLTLGGFGGATSTAGGLTGRAFMENLKILLILFDNLT